MILSENIIAELTQSELCAQLRIIAADERRLSTSDRRVILSAAAEIEIAYRQLLANNAAFFEMSGHNRALKDRIDALTPKDAWSAGANVSVRWP